MDEYTEGCIEGWGDRWMEQTDWWGGDARTTTYGNEQDVWMSGWVEIFLVSYLPLIDIAVVVFMRQTLCHRDMPSFHHFSCLTVEIAKWKDQYFPPPSSSLSEWAVTLH